MASRADRPQRVPQPDRLCDGTRLTSNEDDMNTATFKGTLYDDMTATKEAPAASPPSATQPPEATTARNEGVAVRLVPGGAGDSAVVANYVAVNPSHGLVYIDFGFLDPGLLLAVQRLLQEGKELPEVVNGRLASRMALSYDVVVQLYGQLVQLLAGMQKQQEAVTAVPS
jgi:hypothetical protein